MICLHIFEVCKLSLIRTKRHKVQNDRQIHTLYACRMIKTEQEIPDRLGPIREIGSKNSFPKKDTNSGRRNVTSKQVKPHFSRWNSS